MKIRVNSSSEHYNTGEVFDAILDTEYNEFYFRTKNNIVCVLSASELDVIDDKNTVDRIKVMIQTHYLTALKNGASNDAYFVGMYNALEGFRSLLENDRAVFYDERVAEDFKRRELLSDS